MLHNLKNKLWILPGVLFLGILLFSFNPAPDLQSKEWVVPDSYKNMKNPVKADREGLAIAKNLYSKHCKSCHGKEGFGDGPKAEELETPVPDFTMDEVQSQSDGSLYYKTTEGRDDMPSFEKKIPSDEDRWLIVSYIRSLAE